MRHVSRTHRVALDWLFDRINFDPKIQIKYIDTENQLADILTKGNFTRDAWNHLLCLFNISHFSSSVCSEGMSKRTQEEPGEDRVTAKTRPMMSLIAHSSERAPSALSYIASESLVKTRQESQSLLSAQAEMYDRTVKLVVCRDTSHERHRLVENAHSSSYSEWNIDKTWFSREWNSDEIMDDGICPQRGAHASQTRFSREHKNVILEEEENHDRTVRPVVCLQGGAHQFIIEDDETDQNCLSIQIILAQGEWSSAKKAKTILNRCNRRQRSGECSCLQHCKHLYSRRRIIQTIGIPSRIQKISQLNRCSTYLRHWCPNNQMRSMDWKQLFGKTLHGSIVFDWWWTSHQSSTHKSLRILNFCIVSWKDEREPSRKHSLGRNSGVVQKFIRIQNFGSIDGEPIEFEWNIFPGFKLFLETFIFDWWWRSHQSSAHKSLRECFEVMSKRTQKM